MAGRSFLFLQGLASPFMFRLGKRLRGQGHAVARVNLSGADVVFWPARAINFRGTPEQWPAFIATTLEELRATDLVLFGDCRPFHRIAIEQARERGIATHIFEEGYFRPNWITLEQDGTNGYSSLPRDPDGIRALAARAPDPPPVKELTGSFFNRAVWDVAANVCGALLWPMFRHYSWHGTDHPFVEYAGWLRRLVRSPADKRRSRQTIARVVDAGLPYYLVPLQLHSDYQIRVHSSYAQAVDALGDIMLSFARSAPAGTHLLFKLHPLDNGLYDYAGRIAGIARRLDLADRVHVADEPDLAKLIERCRGVVLVNSSVATLALEHGRAVKALGVATYDMPGLTFQGPLDAFWTSATPPDPELYRAYRRAVLSATQINGGFFTLEAIETGTRLAAEKILATRPSA